MLTLPNLLTLSRIFAVPLLVALLWWPDWSLGHGIAFVLYALAGITDPLNAFLAFAPGGQSEMAIIAIIAGADLAFVIMHHLMRVILVITLAPIANRWLGKG